jgi:hypothetical protein
MKKNRIGIIGACMVGLMVGSLFAGTPVKFTVTLTESATAGHTTEWSVPAWDSAALLSIQNVGDDSSSTLAIKHVVKISDTVSVTNTVETAIAYTATVNYPLALLAMQYYSTNTAHVATYSPPTPRYVSYGDKLLFTYNATNYSGKAIIWLDVNK